MKNEKVTAKKYGVKKSQLKYIRPKKKLMKINSIFDLIPIRKESSEIKKILTEINGMQQQIITNQHRLFSMINPKK